MWESFHRAVIPVAGTSEAREPLLPARILDRDASRGYLTHSPRSQPVSLLGWVGGAALGSREEFTLRAASLVVHDSTPRNGRWLLSRLSCLRSARRFLTTPAFEVRSRCGMVG